MMRRKFLDTSTFISEHIKRTIVERGTKSSSTTKMKGKENLSSSHFHRSAKEKKKINNQRETRQFSPKDTWREDSWPKKEASIEEEMGFQCGSMIFTILEEREENCFVNR
jgi:hypothetical protein